MSRPRLKSKMWVLAQIRLCDSRFIPAVVVRSGDPDAGVILLKINRREEGCRVLSQVTTLDGERGWMNATGEAPVDEAAADAYIDRQRAIDPDLWVLEIDDPEGRYAPDGPITA